MTRTGKIARLPRDIREQLNRRLADGESGVRLVRWLNELPQAVAVWKAEFGGRAATEQNLSEWKQGGFRDWEARQETLAQARELSADAKELSEAVDGSLADHLAMTLSARYAGMLSGWNGEADENFRRKLRTLRLLCQDIVELRRGDHSASRLKLEQEVMAEKKEWSEEELVEHFQRWARNTKVREAICRGCVSLEERETRLREVFGLAPLAPKKGGEGIAASESQAESEQIKPNQTS